MTCGIYHIKNKINLKKYVGSSYKIEDRCQTHFDKLVLGTHRNKYLQSAWDKYGADNFEFRIIHICSREELLKLEQSYLPVDKTVEALKAQGFYNQNPLTSGSDRPHTAEERLKQSNAQKGKPRKKHTTEVKSKMNAYKKGKKLSEEVKSRMSNGHRGNKHSEETKLKISHAQKGKKLSSETKAKISATWAKKREEKEKKLISK